MTPLTNTGIDINNLHGNIHLYLIIKNTLLNGARICLNLNSAVRAHTGIFIPLSPQ